MPDIAPVAAVQFHAREGVDHVRAHAPRPDGKFFGFVVADRFAVGTFFAADLQRCELADGALGLLRDAPALSSLSSSPLATVPLMCSAKSVTWVRI